MATQLQLRRGTTSQIAAFTGANGEIAVDTDVKTIYVQDGATAGGFAMARADFSNISASATLTLGTLNATTLNVTTLDLTTLEVTTIKAKDGTAAGSIADSTGVVTIASAVLTTADINAGTFDGVVGGTTPAAGSFTTITGSGNLVIDTTTLVVDSSNNRVGVGTSSPTTLLDVKGSEGNSVITLNSAASIDSYPSIGKLRFFSDDSSTNSSGEVGSLEVIGIGNWNGGRNKPAMTFNLIQGLAGTTSPVEAARIDASGNFMIGTTDTDNQNNSAGSAADNGFAYGGTNGYLNVARYNGIVSYFNRTGTAGEIVQFRKNGSAVGHITASDAVSSDLSIYSTASNHVGLQFGNTRLHPTDNAGATTDGVCDIGNSTTRFKDLYLSNGIVFDAVAGGATSNRLDDYEEGSFSIGVEGTTATLANTTAYYTKIGRLVYFFWYSGNSTFASSSGSATLTGLPFHQDGLSANYGLFQYVHGNAVDGDSTGGYINNNGTKAFFVDGGSFGGATFIDGSTKFIMVQGVYQTDG